MSIFVSSNYETNPQNAEIIMSNLRKSNINNLDLDIKLYNENEVADIIIGLRNISI